MAFGHEQLDVYKLALEYVAYVFDLSIRSTAWQPC